MNEKFIKDTNRLKNNLETMGYIVEYTYDERGEYGLMVRLQTNDEAMFKVFVSSNTDWDFSDIRESLVMVGLYMNHELKGHAVRTNLRMPEMVKFDESKGDIPTF